MFPNPQNYITQPGTGVPPVFGGAVAALSYAFTYTTTAATVVFTLPAGATIIGFDLVVNTTFDGSATLSVGATVVASSATYYMNAASALDTAGPVYSTAWATSGKWWTRLDSAEPVTITIGGSPTQGAGVLAVRYVMQQ